jgi:hypothetical protein
MTEESDMAEEPDMAKVTNMMTNQERKKRKEN